MPKKRSQSSSKAINLPGVRRTIVRKPDGVVHTRYSAWRGGPAIGTYKGTSLAECEAAAKADAADIAERYATARSKASGLDTVAGLLDAYERSIAFKKLSESTKAEWSRILNQMQTGQIGKLKTIALKAQRAPAVLAKWHDDQVQERGARAGDYRLTILRRALSWNMSKGNCAANPALGIESAWTSDRSELIWEPQMIEAFREHIRVEVDRVWFSMKATDPNRARIILRLAAARDALTTVINTGMRREDVSVFAKQWIGDGVIVYTARKGARRARTKGKQARVTIVPILPEMALMLARREEAHGADSPWVITSSRGGNYTPNAIGTLVGDVSREAKIERHLHDGKGTFVTRLKIETDLTEEEIAETVDWSREQVRNVIRRYVSAAAIGAAMRARFKRKSGT